MKTWFREKLIDFICHWIVVGGHCGICGNYVPNVLLPSYWRITICEKCLEKHEEKH